MDNGISANSPCSARSAVAKGLIAGAMACLATAIVSVTAAASEPSSAVPGVKIVGHTVAAPAATSDPGENIPGADEGSDSGSSTDARIRQKLDDAARLRQESPVDWRAVQAAYESAAALGSRVAMSHVGWMHENGKGTPVDLQEAARWYEPVAEAGQTEYAIKLGWLYLDPALGPDRQQSTQWFQRAIDSDSSDARVALASVWVADAMGGNDAHLNEAHHLLEQALQQGHPLASHFLARIHVEQIGGYESSAASRLRYTQLAAQDGHAPMQVWLAQRYLDGDGVTQDRLAAATWAALAAAQGDRDGIALHETVQADLSDEERREVLQRTLTWAMERGEAPQVRAGSPR